MESNEIVPSDNSEALIGMGIVGDLCNERSHMSESVNLVLQYPRLKIEESQYKLFIGGILNVFNSTLVRIDMYWKTTRDKYYLTHSCISLKLSRPLQGGTVAMFTYHRMIPKLWTVDGENVYRIGEVMTLSKYETTACIDLWKEDDRRNRQFLAEYEATLLSDMESLKESIESFNVLLKMNMSDDSYSFMEPAYKSQGLFVIEQEILRSQRSLVEAIAIRTMLMKKSAR
ncbi:Hypothetical protein POVR2_LOCUS54 [uncultured virus]|nr:Hypothetical protein POVR2_LOCUS54 [uncultured virus]